MRERKSGKSNPEQQPLQQHQNGHLSRFKLAKLLDPDASWDKDQLGDVLHWIRQALALVCGLLWGAIPLVGGIWFILFVVFSTGIIYAYYSLVLKVDEEEFGGHGALLQEGLFASISLFLLAWILARACRDTGELDRGIYIHSVVESKDRYKRSRVLGNALVDMYAKSGNMERARAVFDKMPQKDVISWTSIIVGHAINGEGVESLAAFKQMCAEKIVPNPVTFIGLLSACDHAGLVDDGKTLYDTMCEAYHIKPQIEHFGCMIDMLARAGKLKDAEMFIKRMPTEPNTLVWRMLINACRVHNHVDLGLKLVTGMEKLNTSLDPADHVISSNIFAEAGRWGDVISHRKLQKVPKVPGKSLIT